MNSLRLRDGQELHFEEYGTGQPALLIHGFTGSCESWGPELLADLSSELRVIAVDLLGHGLSSKPHDPSRYAIEAQVQDLTELLQSLGLERAIWIGYSMGGRIALAGGALRPDKIDSLVLEGASPGLELAEDRAARRRSDDALASELERNGIEAFVNFWESLPLFETQQRLPAAVRAAQRERRLQNDPRALAASLRGCGTGTQPCFWDPLRNLPTPALLMAGELDTKFRQLGDDMALRIPKAVRVTIGDAGHTTHLEQPREYGQQVRVFARNSAGAPQP